MHYPDGVMPDQYNDMLGLVRIFDKTMRIAHNRDWGGETPWRDISGYGLLGTRRTEREKKKKKNGKHRK